tara:strand:+ start:467 stop:808 length:342 start_codon:yes stop_codon:yes gene_type:complete
MEKRIKELEDKIATLEKSHKTQRMQNEGAYNGFYATLNLLEKADPIKAIMVRAQNKGYLKGLKFALNLIKYKVDENAETLEDKLRVEHMPIPEEREDANLFETLANKFRPKYE